MKSSLFSKTLSGTGFKGLRAAGILVMLLFVQTILSAQTTIYIDPTNTSSNQNGTITNPYSSWNQVTFTNGNTYLQKRGTTFNTTGGITLTSKSNITLGAYGTGAKPIIQSSSASARIVRLTSSSNCIINYLDITSTTGNVGPIAIGIDGSSSNNLVDSCHLHNCEYGVNMGTTVGVVGNRILRSVIHNIGDDGMYLKDMKTIEVGNCHIYDVNRKYLINPNQSYSAGDCVQIVGNPTVANALSINIHDNILDHSNMGNKFCLIVVGDYYSGTIERNVMTGSGSTSCIYLWHTTGTITVRKNVLRSSTYGIYSYVHDLQVQYNKFYNNTVGISVLPSALTQTNLTTYNNVFYNPSSYCIAMNTCSTPSVLTSKNNAFFLIGSSAKAYVTSNSQVTSNHNNFNIQQSGFINSYSTLASWQTATGNDINSFVANPLFVNPSTADFCLQSNSPCINTGNNVGLNTDFFETAVPQANGPDVGLHEVVSTTGNQAPVISNQSFSIAENSINGTLVGQVIAMDPNSGQTLTYSITAGNSSNAFTVNSVTGALSVANAVVLNYETMPAFQLTVQVQDNGAGNLTASAIISINLTNVNEVPSMSGQSFSVNENAVSGLQVGTMSATDPDQGQTLTYSIASGNTNAAFAINATTGAITVSNSQALNYETTQNFQLVIRAQDNGTPSLFVNANAAITVINVNEVPSMSGQTYNVNENAAAGMQVGTMTATDPDQGQTLTYSITSGNTNSAFAINATTGAITVSNSQALNYEATQNFQLVIRAQDNGTPALYVNANAQITVINVNETPAMGGQSFTVNENAVAGFQVGTMTATDPDQGQSLTYSITSGNTNAAFAINATTGVITVSNTLALNFESIQNFQLVIRAQDNGTPSLFVNANAQISIVNVNENPIINNQTFYVASYTPNGTLVGTVIALDPDQNQVLNYSIIAGNSGTAFAIDANTGAITVANSAAINYITNPVYSLTIRVQDNGSPVLASLATITINVTPTNTAPVINNQTFAINENSPQGTIVGQVIASDPDPGQTLAYSIISGNTGTTFQISATGQISVANAQLLNFENTASFQLVIQVTDNGLPPMASSTNIIISVNNVNENPVVTPGQSFGIAEHVPAGTQVGIISATDPDNGQNLTYSIISGNTNNVFSISSSTGMISIAGTVCFEACSQYSLVVRATDNGSPVLNDQKAVIIILTDVNENPVINNQTFAVSSYSAVGTIVGTVVASDPDLNQVLSYSITSGNTGNTFAVNQSTGVITVANNSLLSYLTNPVFNLIVRAQDNGTPALSSLAAVTISVTPVNTSPVITNQSFSVNENMPGGVIVGNVVASDPDPGQSISFTLTAGNTSGAFQLGANGILSIANPSAINYELNPVFNLSVQVTDNGQPQLTATAVVTVAINNLNETPVINGNLSFSVNEQTAPGTTVGTISASDPDAGQALLYSITSGNTNNAFAISASTGIITVNGNISFENCSQYSLIIRVSDNGSPALWAEGQSTIQIIDVNELPVINNQTFSAISFAANGTIIGTINATDPDANQTLAYSILSGNTSGAFTLNSATGDLLVANSMALNPATNPVFQMMVMVQDNGSPVMSSTAMITVSLNGQNSAPVIAPQAYTINENIPSGTVVGTIQASDPNSGQTLSFSIISGNSNNAFAVSSAGILSINNAQAIDFETNPSFTLLIMVSDNGSPVLWAQAPVTVNIINVNDPPVMLPQTYVAKENIPSGRYVCKVIATDQDPGDTFQSYIMSGNTNNAFKIQSYTSRIFVDNAAALNFEVNPVFYLTIRCIDNHGAYSEQIITINIEDINEAPVVLNQSFTVNQNAPNGTFIGKVIATDPDQGQILRYSITQGNTNGIFAIGLTTGNLTVANSSALQNSTANSFLLTVKVRDNGSPVLYSNGYMTIAVNRNKETGELTAETLPVRLNLELTVYPNPSSNGLFNVELKEETMEETALIITDIAGKKVREESFSGMMIYRIDLSEMPSGIYLMHAKNAQKHSVSKLIRP